MDVKSGPLFSVQRHRSGSQCPVRLLHKAHSCPHLAQRFSWHRPIQPRARTASPLAARRRLGHCSARAAPLFRALVATLGAFRDSNRLGKAHQATGRQRHHVAIHRSAAGDHQLFTSYAPPSIELQATVVRTQPPGLPPAVVAQHRARAATHWGQLFLAPLLLETWSTHVNPPSSDNSAASRNRFIASHGPRLVKLTLTLAEEGMTGCLGQICC